jgi:enamine deaminase RidA (YjgF/YER057c/UK114 family)
MAATRRVNLRSGRPLERHAHASDAVRVQDTVLLAGTTATDRQGSVRGVGNVSRQVDAILAIAEWSLDRLGSGLDDVVRSRIYVADARAADPAARTLARRFRDVRPAATLVQVSRLARPELLVEIELDAVDGARRAARHVGSGRALEDEYAYSRAVRLGDRVFVSGTTALTTRGGVASPESVYRQTRIAMDTIFQALDEAGAAADDLVYTKTFLTSASGLADYTRAWLEALGPVRPASTLLVVPALVNPAMLVEIEAEAIVGAARTRRDIYTEQMREKPRGYARAVEVGDWIHVSGCTALDPAGHLRAAGDWAAQYELAVETIRWTLAEAKASLDDVVRRRTFTVDAAEMSPSPRRGPAWFAASAPAALGCRVEALARPELLVEIEVTAVKGAGAAIESAAPDREDPLDRVPA